jgi:hypothetical protein
VYLADRQTQMSDVAILISDAAVVVVKATDDGEMRQWAGGIGEPTRVASTLR